SEQFRPAKKLVRVCDLCGERVDTYSHRDWTVLNAGYYGAGDSKPVAKSLFTFFRKRHTEHGSGAPYGDNRKWQWDFHGECLVNALTPLVVAGVPGRK